MLAVPWDQPFDDPEWGFELKWDGVRAIAYSDGESLKLVSRNGNDLTPKYPALANVVLPVGVLDGEVVALDDGGLPSFALLASDPQGSPLAFVAFDLLEASGRPLVGTPLRTRRERLLEFVDGSPVAANDMTIGEGVDLFDAVSRSGLEGIVAKRLDSPYQSGTRSSQWRKVLNLSTSRCLVLGYTVSDRGLPFSALALGMYHDGRIRYVGRVGSGFSESDRSAIRVALDQMPGPPLSVENDEPIVWCEPQLVAHVQFRNWTPAGRLRGPVFKGFGAEPPESVTWESEGPTT